MPVTILMPMAGRGSRFAREGETRPKPLIPVLRVPMFRLALASIRRDLPDAQTIAVVLAEHESEFGIQNHILAADRSAHVVVIPDVTGGTLETCLAAAPLAEHRAGPLIVLDCDLTFASPDYLARIRAMEAGQDDSNGLLLSFRSTVPHYSFAATDGDRVTRTAEKDAISDRALAGAYGFGSNAAFFAAARDIVARNIRTGNGEYYVSSVYNRLIEAGATVRLAEASRLWSVGTPEELRSALSDPAFRDHVQALDQAWGTER